MKRKLFAILFCFVTSISLYGQSSALSIPFQKLFNNNNDNKYIGQFIKEKRNGLGILKFQDGALFIGEFSDNKIEGTGTIIAPLNDNIKNCPSCVIYVGHFKNGMKEGYGTCYNDAGVVIYHGSFSNDKPISSYPNNDINYNSAFSIIETPDKKLYIGEISHNGIPNGQGTFFYIDGEAIYGEFSNGKNLGVSIVFLSEGGWETYCLKKDGRVLPISSSKQYAIMDEVRVSVTKEIRDKRLSELSDNLMELSDNLMELSKSLIDLSNSVNETSQARSQQSDFPDGTSTNTNGNQSKTTQNTNNSQKGQITNDPVYDKLRSSQMCHTYEFSYNQYADQLTSWKVFCKDFSQSERMRIQKEMKNLRKKVTDIDPSSPITKNSIEDWDGHCNK